MAKKVYDSDHPSEDNDSSWHGSDDESVSSGPPPSYPSAYDEWANHDPGSDYHPHQPPKHKPRLCNLLKNDPERAKERIESDQMKKDLAETKANSKHWKKCSVKLNQTVAAKDTAIGQLKTQNAAKDAKIAELKAIIEADKAEKKEQERHRALMTRHHDNTAKLLEDTFDSKRKSIQEKKKEMEAKKVALAQEEKDLDEEQNVFAATMASYRSTHPTNSPTPGVAVAAGVTTTHFTPSALERTIDRATMVTHDEEDRNNRKRRPPPRFIDDNEGSTKKGKNGGSAKDDRNYE